MRESTFTLVYWGFIPSFPTKDQLVICNISKKENSERPQKEVREKEFQTYHPIHWVHWIHCLSTMNHYMYTHVQISWYIYIYIYISIHISCYIDSFNFHSIPIFSKTLSDFNHLQPQPNPFTQMLFIPTSTWRFIRSSSRSKLCALRMGRIGMLRSHKISTVKKTLRSQQNVFEGE